MSDILILLHNEPSRRENDGKIQNNKLIDFLFDILELNGFIQMGLYFISNSNLT